MVVFDLLAGVVDSEWQNFNRASRPALTFTPMAFSSKPLAPPAIGGLPPPAVGGAAPVTSVSNTPSAVSNMGAVSNVSNVTSAGPTPVSQAQRAGSSSELAFCEPVTSGAVQGQTVSFTPMSSDTHGPVTSAPVSNYASRPASPPQPPQ